MVWSVWRTQLLYKANSLGCNLHGPVLLYQDLFLGVQPDLFLPGLLLDIAGPPSQLDVALIGLTLPNLILCYIR